MELFSAMDHAIHNIVLVVIVFLVVDSSCSTYKKMSNKKINHDIEQLSLSLPGCYSNAKQYYAYAMKAGPLYHKNRHTNLFLLRAEYYKLESPLFNDSLTVYFQDFTKGSKTPFSSGFYSFTPDLNTSNIRMKVYLFKEAVPGLELSFSNYSIPRGSLAGQRLVDAFHKAQMKTHASCDMLWKKVGVRMFIGVTRSACLASLGEESVRVSVSMTLTGSRITLTEGWYNIDHRTQLRELKVPYVLKRKQESPSVKRSKSPPKQKPVVIRNKKTNTFSLKARENIIRENLSTYHKLRTINKKRVFARKTTPVGRRLKSLRPASRHYSPTRSRKTWSSSHARKRRHLRSFRHVRSSLTAGRRVFYSVDLSGCAMPQQVPVDRLSFGGRVQKFLIIREKHSRKKRTKIYFSTSRTSMSYRGAMTIHREMTLHRGGRVEVKVTKRLTGKLPTKYIFQCKLNKNHKGSRGSVNLFADFSVQAKKAKSLHKMTTALSQGRELWLVTDVSGCHGGLSDTIVTVGSAIADYDLVNDGRILEVFLPLDRNSPQVSEGNLSSGFDIKIFQNGDVILTWVSETNEETDLRRKFASSPSYHCELTNQLDSHTNDVGKGSVAVFYR